MNMRLLQCQAYEKRENEIQSQGRPDGVVVNVAYSSSQGSRMRVRWGRVEVVYYKAPTTRAQCEICGARGYVASNGLDGLEDMVPFICGAAMALLGADQDEKVERIERGGGSCFRFTGISGGTPNADKSLTSDAQL